MKVLNTGKKRYEIPFANGEVAVLEFNPVDYLFILKFQNLEKIVGDIILEHNKKRKSVLGLKELDLTKNTIDKIYEAFDDVFGKGAGNEIFKVCSPLSLIEVNGKSMYYPFYFISEFMPEVAKDIEANSKKSAAKAEEYLKKYTAEEDAK